MEYSKPIPVPDNASQPFWEGARNHKLLLQRCCGCGTIQSFPQSCCRKCLSGDIEWFEASGKGKIYSFTVIHRPPSQNFEEDIPYIVAIIELDEGPRVMSNIIGMTPEDAKVDMTVEVIFDDISSTISLPKFRPFGNDGPS
jgi:uncharacterized OB-fold protein